MTRIYTGIAAFAVLAACSGTNPFTTGASTGGGSGVITAIPPEIANDLDSLSYDPTTQTLTVTGLTQDGTPLSNTYTFVSDGQQVLTTSTGSTYTAFVNGYTTFTSQNDPLGRHATAFVATRDGVQAGVVITGGQFNKFFGGVFYERTGAYAAPVAPPDRFDVTYHGTYAAGLNARGPDTNLLPTTGLDPDVDVPVQAGYVRGLMFVNVDLNDLSVEGEIYNRSGVLVNNSGDPTDVPGFTGLPDIVLVEGSLADDGTFAGNLEVDGQVGDDVGDFAGIIGGANGETMAGGTTLTEFEDTFENEIEYGVFVLDLCQPGDTSPVCTNALP